MEKTCSKCNNNLDIRLFSPNKLAKDGLHSQCKNCRTNVMKSLRSSVKYEPDPSLIEKQCCTCKEIKVINDFSLNKSSKDGYHFRCRKCHNEKRRKK